MKMNKLKKLAAAVAVLVALAVPMSVHASTASAWVWSGHVNLQGSSICGSNATTWVWVSAPNGESGWATNGRAHYLKVFNRVPANGMWVRINYGNATFKCHDSVFVRRAKVGSTNTVNLFKLIPNG